MNTAPRKLATIVALDVAGYSARTEADEAKTTAEVAVLRHVIEGIAKAHGGRVFNTAGDGFMLEFASSLAAVEAAGDLAQTCEPKVRIGVHLGDVVVQPNGDLLGHGVNVAARLMAKSDPGAALISADVRRTIRGPFTERLVSRGLMQLDKMAETIEAFALVAVSIAALPVLSQSGGEPVLAVLPFDNLSSDAELQFFSDGVSEEILQALARSSGLRVIGRTSAFQFRGARKGEAARFLKATHILDGAVRKAGARVRVSAQLTETAGGAALWSEKYDESLTDALAVQDDIAVKVATALSAVLANAPKDKKIDPHAYELYLKALTERALASDDSFRRAEILLEEVVALAPNFAEAWACLGGMRIMLLPLDRDSAGTPRYNAALAATKRALALDPNCASAYRNLANLKPAFGDYADRIALARRSAELAPNDAVTVMGAAGALICVGRCKESSAEVFRGAALDPMNPLGATGVVRRLESLGRGADAHAHVDEAIKIQSPSFWTTSAKFILFFNAGRYAEAASYLEASPLGGDAEFGPAFRLMLALPTLAQEQRLAFFQSILEPVPSDRPLALTDCMAAVRFGCADLAFGHLFSALDTGRPIVAWRGTTHYFSRSSTLIFVFNLVDNLAFRADKRFPTFCARVGLVDYWRTSGHWPDCADEVPYDFKAECEKAARELANNDRHRA